MKTIVLSILAIITIIFVIIDFGVIINCNDEEEEIEETLNKLFEREEKENGRSNNK